jgi:hypothetical protein
LQQAEFAMREMQFAGSADGRPRHEVDEHRPESQAVGMRPRPAEDGVDAG